jgi:hypothetical protein
MQWSLNWSFETWASKIHQRMGMDFEVRWRSRRTLTGHVWTETTWRSWPTCISNWLFGRIMNLLKFSSETTWRSVPKQIIERKALPSYHLGNSGVKDKPFLGMVIDRSGTSRTSSSTSLHCVDEAGHGGGGGDAIEPFNLFWKWRRLEKCR